VHHPTLIGAHASARRLGTVFALGARQELGSQLRPYWRTKKAPADDGRSLALFWL